VVDSRLRIGIAGLGIASSYTMPVFASHPRSQVVAAADTRPAALARFAAEYEGETFESIEALCTSPDVNVVYVATPNFLHAEHAILAAEHGKHLIVEKPMAISLGQCDAMIEAAERNEVQLVCGHTHSFNPPIQAMRELVRGGTLGPLTMLHTWNYTDLLSRPRAAWELDTARGGGVVFIQAPHQIDMVRLIGGGLVRSVRAMAGSWAADRPTEGNYTAYLEFEDGAPATLVYSGYSHFDTAELHDWIGERGQPRDPATNAQSLAGQTARAAAATDEEVIRDARRYGGTQDRSPKPGARPDHQQFFGYLLVSCQHGDLRQSPDGLYLYGQQGKEELPVPLEPTGAHRMIDELADAVAGIRAPLHDGRWAKATVEVCLAILQSSRERREIFLTHQVSTNDG
jgi:phthalate 4,5-cis-dihydrodiol dehydrogenase